MGTVDYIRVTKLALDGDETASQRAYDEAMKRQDSTVIAALVAMYPQLIPQGIGGRSQFRPLFDTEETFTTLQDALGSEEAALQAIGWTYAVHDEPPLNTLERRQKERLAWLYPEHDFWEGYEWEVESNGYTLARGTSDDMAEAFIGIERDMGYYPGWSTTQQLDERGAILTITLDRWDDDDMFEERHLITVQRADEVPFTERERNALRWGPTY